MHAHAHAAGVLQTLQPARVRAARTPTQGLASNILTCQRPCWRGWRMRQPQTAGAAVRRAAASGDPWPLFRCKSRLEAYDSPALQGLRSTPAYAGQQTGRRWPSSRSTWPAVRTALPQSWLGCPEAGVHEAPHKPEFTAWKRLSYVQVLLEWHQVSAAFASKSHHRIRDMHKCIWADCVHQIFLCYRPADADLRESSSFARAHRRR